MDEIERKVVAFRRDMHQHAELSWGETRTSEKVIEFLAGLGITARRITKTGVIADIPGAAAGPFVGLRGDMDALPITEETGLEFASVNPGVMHACGHDGHTSMVLGAASILMQQVRDGNPPPLPVRLVFQPAEEVGDGAKTMCENGCLEGVAMMFGGHLDRHYDTGIMVVHNGCVNASSDTFAIDVIGKSGHAARPHQCVDSIVVASNIVMALQTIVSREINPAEGSVLTVGKFTAGTQNNIIAGTARLEGTVRAVSKEVRATLKDSLVRIARSVAEAYNAKAEVTFSEETPPVLNDPASYELAKIAATEIVGEASVIPLPRLNMGAEDFSYYLEQVPGCFVRYGTAIPGKEEVCAHSSLWDMNEDTLMIGARYLANVVRVAGNAILKK